MTVQLIASYACCTEMPPKTMSATAPRIDAFRIEVTPVAATMTTIGMITTASHQRRGMTRRSLTSCCSGMKSSVS